KSRPSQRFSTKARVLHLLEPPVSIFWGGRLARASSYEDPGSDSSDLPFGCGLPSTCKVDAQNNAGDAYTTMGSLSKEMRGGTRSGRILPERNVPQAFAGLAKCRSSSRSLLGVRMNQFELRFGIRDSGFGVRGSGSGG